MATHQRWSLAHGRCAVFSLATRRDEADPPRSHLSLGLWALPCGRNGMHYSFKASRVVTDRTEAIQWWSGVQFVRWRRRENTPMSPQSGSWLCGSTVKNSHGSHYCTRAIALRHQTTSKMVQNQSIMDYLNVLIITQRNVLASNSNLQNIATSSVLYSWFSYFKRTRSLPSLGSKVRAFQDTFQASKHSSHLAHLQYVNEL